MKIGDRVTLQKPHVWAGHSGVVESKSDFTGVGKGFVVKLDRGFATAVFDEKHVKPEKRESDEVTP